MEIYLVVLLALFVSMLFFIYPVFILAFVFVCFFLFAVWRYPKETVVWLLFFLIFQDLLAYWFMDLELLYFSIKFVEEICLLVVFCRMLFMKGQLFLWLKNDITLPLFILVVVALLSSLISNIVPFRIGLLDLFILLKAFLAYYIFSSFEWGERALKRVITPMFVVFVVVLFLGFIDFLAPTFFRNLIGNRTYIDYRFGFPSIVSVFIHPSVFGWFMAGVAGFCFAFYDTKNERSYLFWLILFMVGALFSFRLKSIMGLAVALPTLVFLSNGVYKRFKLSFLLVVVFGVMIIFWGRDIIGLFDMQIYNYVTRPDLYNVARNVLYEVGFLLAKDFFPFGSGLGTFGGHISSLYYSPIYEIYGISHVYGLQEGGNFISDTFWPYIMGQFGFVGLAVYCWIFFLLLKQLYLTFSSFSFGYGKAFVLGSFVLFVQSIVVSIADPVFLRPPQNIFIFACLGISYAVRRNTQENEYTYSK
jgi:hypothetical protein